MSRQQNIENKLQQALQPLHREVVNESHQHSVSAGAETHFRVVVVAAAFEGEMLVRRHQRVNALLAEEFAGGMHALALHTWTPAEWAERQAPVQDSPPCLGGSKEEGS